jgi:hypothetical protein
MHSANTNQCCNIVGMWAELEHLLKLGQLSTHELPDLIPSLLANNQFVRRPPPARLLSLFLRTCHARAADAGAPRHSQHRVRCAR